MELNAKPTEYNIVVVHDKILMALLGAYGIKPLHMFTTGWHPDNPTEIREQYAAYEGSSDVIQISIDYKEKTIAVHLDDYLSSADELENYVGRISYIPSGMKGTENE
jgi:hypothetical protein